MGLVRLLLNPAVLAGVTIGEALDALRGIRSLPIAQFWPDASSLADQRAITGHITGPKQVTDTHLLNLAIANGGILATFDGKFPRALNLRDRRHVRVLAS
jgi:hypothetical protein